MVTVALLHTLDPSRFKSSIEETGPLQRMNGDDQVIRFDVRDQDSLLNTELLPSLDLLPELPSVDDYFCILQKIKKHKTLSYAKQVHVYACHSGLELHSVLGNYMMQSYLECESLCDAQKVFNRMLNLNEYSWASLIQAYMERGEQQHAFYLYQKMQEDHPTLSSVTLISLLRSCSKLKSVKNGQGFHAEIVNNGYETDANVGSNLVGMYAKLGFFPEARDVFDELPEQDVVAWNALLLGYVDYDLWKETLTCLEEMQVRGVFPDPVTFVCCLKACSSMGAISTGQKISADIFTEGYESEYFVRSAMVDMFAKCGSLGEAREVFDELPSRDVVLWNTLLSGYTDHGCFEEALTCLHQMRFNGVSENGITWVCYVKACAGLGAIGRGREIHADIVREGYDVDHYISNSLVDMYVKCGLFMDAGDVFSELASPDVISWTTFIAGYSEHGSGEAALRCLKQMQLEGVSPNAATLVCSLKACGSMSTLCEGLDIHSQVVKKGYEVDRNVGNTLVDMYAKCGLFEEAIDVFKKLRARDVVSWTALIAGYAEHDHGEAALDYLWKMQSAGVYPNAITHLCTLKACASIGAVDLGQQIHAEIAKEGFEEKISIANTLMDMYAKCGLLVEAQEVFDQVSVQDAVSWNILITGYADHGFEEEVLDFYQKLRLKHIAPYAATYLCSLKACGTLGALDNGRQIHDAVVKEADTFSGEVTLDLRQPADVTLATVLIDMYAKCGLMADAQQVFDAFPARELVIYNVLLTGYACQGESESVFHLFGKMKVEGIQPDEVTFLGVLNVCSHGGFISMGKIFFSLMGKDYSVAPTLKHYNCLVDLLGRGGQVEEAVAIVNKMLLQPDFVVWSTLLGACRKWGKIDLGQQAFKSAVGLDDKETAKFVLMSNIYAESSIFE